jgi:transcriptional regulator with XRE-family HTH domain
MEFFVPKSEIGERLKKARGDVSQAKITKRYGLGKNTLSNYETGVTAPKLDFLMQFIQDFNLDANWLLLGEGEPPSADYSAREAMLIADYRASDEEDKRILERTGASFAKSGVDGQDQEALKSAAWPAGEKNKAERKQK